MASIITSYDRAAHSDFLIHWTGKDIDGIVRLTGRELADLGWPRLSRGELTPFSKRRSAVLLEVFAALEMAV
jgi:hypothetical protein